PWVLDGAAVRVAMIGFDNGAESNKYLDGTEVTNINPNLTATLDVTAAIRLPENEGIGFEGIKKNGPFELTATQAREMLAQSGNPNGRPNSDVIKRWINGQDVTGRNN